MTFEPINGNRFFEGRIQKFENGNVTLELSVTKKRPKKGHPEPPSGTIEIALSNIEKANLVPEI
jgi:ribosome maturation factor RimP